MTVTKSAAPRARISAATFAPEDPPGDDDGEAPGVAEIGGADAVSGGTTPEDAVGLGVAETEGEGEVFAAASATYARVPSTGWPSPATTRHASVRLPAATAGSTTCADVSVGNVTSSVVTTPAESVTVDSAPIVSNASENVSVRALPAATVDPSAGSTPTSDVCALAGMAGPIAKSTPARRTKGSAMRRLTTPLSPGRHPTFTESLTSLLTLRGARGSQ